MSLSTSPILAAAASNDLQTVRWLVERESVPVDCSADWLVPDSSGVNNGVKSGADGRGVNGDGAGRKQLERTRRTPLMVAASHGGLEVLSYLLRAGADPNARSEDAERCTAMHCAASGGSAMSAEAIRLLLLFGADRTAADAYGRLPVDVLPGGGVGQNGSVSGAEAARAAATRRRRVRPREPPRPTSTTAGAATTAATTPSATTTTG